MTIVKFAALGCFLFTATTATAQTFDGPYVGASVGYGTGKSNARATLSGAWTSESQALRDHVTSFISDEVDPKGIAYGIQAGFNKNVGGNVVLGGEFDFNLMGIDDDRAAPLTPTPSFPSLSYSAGNGIDVKHMWSLKARAGYAFGNSLVYAQAGWAWTKADYEAFLNSNGGYNKAADERRGSNGFLLGGGFEHMLGGNISARLDYAYTRQKSVSFSNQYLPGSTFVTPAYTETYRQNLKLHLLRLGVNVHF